MSNRQFYLFVDSRNKLYGSNSNFTINSTIANIRSGLSTSISLEECVFYNMQYPVNSNNNSIVFQENSVATDIPLTLAQGSYTAGEFATLLQDAMNAAGSNTYTVTFNDNNSKLTITTSLPDTFKFTSINEIYGFDVMTSFVATKEADNQINLAGVEYVDLMVPGLVDSNLTSSETNTNGMFMRIPLNVGYGDLVTYRSEESDDSIIIDQDRLLNLSFRLRNPDGSDFALPSNSYLSITIKCNLIGDI